MIGVKITYDNGYVSRTSINGPLADVKKYYLGKKFNTNVYTEPENETLVTAVKVELMEDNQGVAK